jgi:small-conductance mechanosensitive channel
MTKTRQQTAANAAENTTGFPLDYEELMNLFAPKGKKEDLMDDFSNVEDYQAHDTSVWRIADYYNKQNPGGSRLKIKRLIKRNPFARVWIEEINAYDTRAEQIAAFADLVFEYVMDLPVEVIEDASHRKIHGLFLTPSTIFGFVPNLPVAKLCFDHICRLSARKPDTLEGTHLRVSKNDFIEFAKSGFNNRHNVVAMNDDLRNNLLSLRKFVRLPVYLVAVFIAAQVAGLQIWQVTSLLVSTMLSFSFAFSKIFQDLFDGLMLVFVTVPFAQGDSISSQVIAANNNGDNMARIRSIGVYSCILEGNCGEKQFLKTTLLANAIVTNNTDSQPWWESVSLYVDVSFSTAELAVIRRAMLNFFSSDPSNFGPLSYVCVDTPPTNLDIGLKVMLRVVIQFAFSQTSSGYSNRTKSRVLEELQFQLAKHGIEYTSTHSAARLTYGLQEEGETHARKAKITGEKFAKVKGD